MTLLKIRLLRDRLAQREAELVSGRLRDLQAARLAAQQLEEYAGMEATLDLEEEARAADRLAESLAKIGAPQKLIQQAIEQARELREEARRNTPAAPG